MNTFKLDYTKRRITLNYINNTYDFDLTKGDVGEFWHSFTDSNTEKIYDINFHQENESEIPTVTIYGVVIKDGQFEQGDEVEKITKCDIVGDFNDYFYPKKGKVAKLVTISLTTRVVVDEDASEEEIIELSRKNFFDKINLELSENIEEIYDDEEMPYNKSYDL